MTSKGSPLSDDLSLLEKHDLKEFKTALEANEERGFDSHHTPGIVTYINTSIEDAFVRIYGDEDGDDFINGKWIARPGSVIGRDRDQLAHLFALRDSRVSDDPWGNYSCVAKAYVPEGKRLAISKAGGMPKDENPVDTSLTGGALQIFVPEGLNHRGLWLPLGTTEKTTIKPEVFRERFMKGEAGDDDTRFFSGDCTDNIYKERYVEDGIPDDFDEPTRY